MFGIESIWLFVISAILLIVAPGPDSALIISRSAAQGFKAGSVASIGIGTGTMVHIVAAAFGLSAIIATSTVAFTIIKILGGMYLIYLAFCMIKSEFVKEESTESATSTPVAILPLKKIYMQGLISNVFNPKMVIFFLSFMPGFIASDAESPAMSFVVLGLIFNTLGMIWAHIMVWATSSMTQTVTVSTTVKVWLNRLTAMLFAYFGVTLLTYVQGL